MSYICYIFWKKSKFLKFFLQFFGRVELKFFWGDRFVRCQKSRAGENFGHVRHHWTFSASSRDNFCGKFFAKFSDKNYLFCNFLPDTALQAIKTRLWPKISRISKINPKIRKKVTISLLCTKILRRFSNFCTLLIFLTDQSAFFILKQKKIPVNRAVKVTVRLLIPVGLCKFSTAGDIYKLWSLMISVSIIWADILWWNFNSI